MKEVHRQGRAVTTMTDFVPNKERCQTINQAKLRSRQFQSEGYKYVQKFTPPPKVAEVSDGTGF